MSSQGSLAGFLVAPGCFADFLTGFGLTIAGLLVFLALKLAFFFSASTRPQTVCPPFSRTRSSLEASMRFLVASIARSILDFEAAMRDLAVAT